MNARIALIAVAVTVVLSLAALILLRPPGNTAQSQTQEQATVSASLQTLAGLDRERIIGLSTASPSGAFEFSLDSEFETLIAGAGSATPWPIDPARPATAMKLLAQSILEASPTDKPSPGSAMRINIRLARLPDAPVTFNVTPTGVGARASLNISNENYTVPATAASLFEPRAVEVWRAPAAFPLLAVAEPEQIICAAKMMNVTLRSENSKSWMIKEVDAPASGIQIEKLLRGLAAIPVVRLVGEVPPEMVPGQTRGTLVPTFTVEVTSVLRRAVSADKITTSTLVQRLSVFAAADAAGQTVQAVATGIVQSANKPERSIYGPMLVTLPRSAIEAISPDRFTYVDPSPLSLPPAEIISIKIATLPGTERITSNEAIDPERTNWPITLTRNTDGSWATRGTRAIGTLPAERITEFLRSLAPTQVVPPADTQNVQTTQPIVTSTPKVKDAPPPTQSGTDIYTIQLATTTGVYTFGVAKCESPKNHAAGECDFVLRRGGLYYYFPQSSAVSLHAFLSEILPSEG